MSENEDTQGADDAPAVPSETMDLSDVLDEWQDYLLSLQDTDEQSSRSVEKALPDLILMHHVRRRVGFLQLPPEGHMDPEEWALRILGADEDSTEWEWYARTLVENAPKSLVATLAAWEGPEEDYGEPWHPDKLKLVRQRVSEMLVTHAEEMEDGS